MAKIETYITGVKSENQDVVVHSGLRFTFDDGSQFDVRGGISL